MSDHREHVHRALGPAGLLTRALPTTPTGTPQQLQNLPELQTRTVQHLQLRVADTEDGTFDGYACLWDTTDSYGTSFRRGAFLAGGLDQLPYALLWMHTSEHVLGTFFAAEDDRGLHVIGRYDDTPEGQTGRARARSGSAAELSVGFVPIGTDPDDSAIFTAVRLVETSQITARMASVPGAGLVGVRQQASAESRSRAAALAVARLRLCLPE